jgi:hypothetical protein
MFPARRRESTGSFAICPRNCPQLPELTLISARQMCPLCAPRRFTMMWQELKHGHRVVFGPENILGLLPDFDLNNMPHEELAKLMLNRGTGLLLARQRMNKAELKSDDVDFIARNIWKAIMACGDAYLALHNTFSYSYRRRSEL